ncbi:MAG: DUF4194 domain-containing protein [Gammaproteobacteria bacterium]|nr:DUF4194 domain-containing protein [Gammaproteobacteria bacterium]
MNEDTQNSSALIDSDLKAVTQELIRYGIVEMSVKAKYYQACLTNQQAIAAILAPLDLKLEIDDIRGLAFLKVLLNEEQAAEDSWSHPLLRRQRMNLEQSLMVAICRQCFIEHELEAGVGAQNARVHIDDLLPNLNQFLGASGSDERDEKRLRQLLDQLKNYGLVSEIDSSDHVIIRPLIAHVANPENLQNLIAALKHHQAKQQ